jgi:hypothetical protein
MNRGRFDNGKRDGTCQICNRLNYSNENSEKIQADSLTM